MEEDIAYENMDALRLQWLAVGSTFTLISAGTVCKDFALKLYTNKSISLCYTH